MSKKIKWSLAAAGFVILAGGGVVFASRSKDSPNGADQLPFRLGKVQAEDLQVSVREVGVVEPETKVDVKSVVSGRVVAMKVRDGAVVKAGDVLAEVEPDVTQAQSLSDVHAGVTQAEVSLKDAERQLASQQRLFNEGLIGSEALKDFVARRDLAAESLKAARKRYEIVEGHGIPISGDGVAQRARVTAPWRASSSPRASSSARPSPPGSRRSTRAPCCSRWPTCARCSSRSTSTRSTSPRCRWGSR